MRMLKKSLKIIICIRVWGGGAMQINRIRWRHCPLGQKKNPLSVESVNKKVYRDKRAGGVGEAQRERSGSDGGG